MLVDLEVVLITDDGSFILSESLIEVLLLLIQQPNLDECVRVSLKSEGIRQDGVLEVRN